MAHLLQNNFAAEYPVRGTYLIYTAAKYANVKASANPRMFVCSIRKTNLGNFKFSYSEKVDTKSLCSLDIKSSKVSL